MSDEWAARVAAVWADADRLSDDELVAQIDVLAAERPEGDALAAFERGGARDSTGREAEAEAFYRAALASGLPSPQRQQAVIQLASTVRNLGRPEESLELLRAEFADRPDDPIATSETAIAALAIAALGRPAEGIAAVLHALAPTLPAYQRSVHAYADSLLPPE
jgi:hypothetical protein